MVLMADSHLLCESRSVLRLGLLDHGALWMRMRGGLPVCLVSAVDSVVHRGFARHGRESVGGGLGEALPVVICNGCRVGGSGMRAGRL